jgi:hypothetical protein
VVVVYSIISHSFLISPLSFRFSRLLIYIYLFCCLKKIKKSFRLAPVLFLSGHPPLGQRLRGKDISACFLRVLFPYIGSPPLLLFSLYLTHAKTSFPDFVYTTERKKAKVRRLVWFFFVIFQREHLIIVVAGRRPPPAFYIIMISDCRAAVMCFIAAGAVRF